MINCKKCGALIGKDFVFCGKCGEPVKNSINNRMVARTKKYTKIRSLRKKIADSSLLNFILSGACFLIGSAFIYQALMKINIISTLYREMGEIYNQYILKYEYIKEGLSFSYAANEYIKLVDYVCLWIFAFLFIIIAAAFLTVFITRLLRGIKILKRSERKTTVFEKTEFIAGIVAVSAIGCVLIAIIVSLYLKGRVL